MVKAKSLLSRSTAIMTVATLVATGIVPALVFSTANAGLIKSRSITLSTSQGGATDVTYEVAFTTDADTTSTIQGIVIDFCDNNPILGDSCTAPTGFDINEAGLAVADTIGGGAFTIDALTSTNMLVLTRTDATVINPNSTLSLTLGAGGASDGVTNPTAGNHTFYARIFTYADDDDDTDGCSNVDDNATCYTSTTPRTFADAGGAALSTANQLLITSKVQERLDFCLYTDGACDAGVEKDSTGAARTNSVILGDENGVLATGGPYVNVQTHFDISTNASGGAVVVLKGDVLKTGSFDITSTVDSGMGAVAGNAYASAANSEQFGLCAFQSSATLLPTGTDLTFSAPYNSANCSTTTQTAGQVGGPGGEGTATFGFNRTAATSNGSTVATKPAGAPNTAELAFIGNIAPTTEAGIYTTTLTFIATGTY